jgi:hypothetical protein
VFNKLIDGLLGHYPLVPIVQPVAPKKDFLPEIEIREKTQREIDQLHLEFLVRLYVSSEGSITEDKKSWFVDEIIYYLRYCYPGMAMHECSRVVQQIIANYKKEKKDIK